MSSMRAATVLRQSCSDLLVTTHHTRTNAIHDQSFVGTLRVWEHFKTNVATAVSFANLNQFSYIVENRPSGLPGPANLKNEQVYCGDETGVQGRWQANIGAAVSGVFKASGQEMACGDYKASAGALGLEGRVPDLVLLDTRTSGLLFPGEVKTPWVTAHTLSDGIDNEFQLRHLLGQIADYMKRAESRYGLLTTYTETILLAQEETLGSWALLYSPVIRHSTVSGPGEPSLRECVWYLSQLARVGARAHNLTPEGQWVRHWHDV